jgi:hypothetical protein
MNGPLSLVYPVLAQVLVTFIAYVRLGQMRHRAFRRDGVRVRDIKLSDDGWPPYARQASNNVRNQFESPVLFYVLCGVATFIAATHVLMAALAWVYVIVRFVHFVIHTTSNHYPSRAFVFSISMIILFVMWVLIVLQLLTA